MSQKKLAQSVILRKTLGALPVGFAAGESLPDWAYEQVKNATHLFEESDFVVDDIIPKPADQDEDESDNAGALPIPNHDEIEPIEVEEEEGPPKRNASRAIWFAYGEKMIEKGYPVELDGDREKIIASLEETGAIPTKD